MHIDENKSAMINKTLTIVGIVLCVILVPILILNCTLIIKSWINKDEVPSIGGVFPLIVLTDSMYPEIKSGDIIFCKTIDPSEIEEKMVISFFDPAGNGTSIVTHQVVGIENIDGKLFFSTKGTNNNTEDRLPVPEEKVVGHYVDFRLPGAGHIALFMQSTPGLIVCVILPIILFVGYDVIRRRLYEKNTGTDVAALMAELEALKAANAAKENTAPAEEKFEAAQDETKET